MPRTNVVLRQKPLRTDAEPFLKWAGGKRRILPQLLPLLPEKVDGYVEPFLGGGAMFFALQPDGAVLSDVNSDLINLYEVVRDQVEALISDLGRHRYEKNYYYRMRGEDPEELSPLGRASRMLYLNRTCFNGLYRVNRRGQFNVPFGRYSNPTICASERLRAVSDVLHETTIVNAGYAQVLESISPETFVYLDPPYQPLPRTANFTSYTADSFTEEDQATLAKTVADLDGRGVKWMLSNSDTPLIRELYKAFRIDVVMAPRAISRSAQGRQAVQEVVVRNY